MRVEVYMAQVEGAVDEPDQLADLERQAEVDEELDAVTRSDVLNRIGQYQADTARESEGVTVAIEEDMPPAVT